MRMYDIILKKRNGHELSKEEIEYFIQNYTAGIIPDYQAAALLMAIYFNKMSNGETANLTSSMINSGEKIDLSTISGVKVDKHSTGGVGDKTSLVLAPMVSACGIPVAKMSGRGLGHTGGTIDKLESIKGFSVEMSRDEFINNVNSIGIAIGGQTGRLVPADKKLYSLRDVTATVDNISLIASSIMSKKIASGADAIVLDVKVGNGAFMKSVDDAFELAREMVNIGVCANKKTIAIISNMDQPLGRAIGNALEVKEALDTLNGRGPDDLVELCLTLGSSMLILAGRVKNDTEARILLEDTITSGKALNKFRQFIKAQGGDDKIIDNPALLPQARYVEKITSKKNGFVKEITAEEVGLACLILGAGRETKESNIDLSVGVILNKKVGDKVNVGDCIATIYGNDKSKIMLCKEKILESFDISEQQVEKKPLIYGIVMENSEEVFGTNGNI